MEYEISKINFYSDSHSSPQAESRRKSGLYALTSDVKEEKKDVKSEKPVSIIAIIVL